MKNIIKKVLLENKEMFNRLTEAQVKGRPKVGDYLFCFRPVIIIDDGEVCTTEGKSYRIKQVSVNELTIVNDLGEDHRFDFDGDDIDDMYQNWFVLEKDLLDTGDIFNIFNNH